MPDRAWFLRRIDERLPFIEEQRTAVLDELLDHLDDSIHHLAATGWGPTAAEEEAVRRMGDPDEVAREIARAQQTRRRLLTAAGGAVFQAGIDGIRVYVAALGAIFITILSIGVLSAVGFAVTAEAIAEVTSGGILGCLGAFLVGRRAPVTLARRSYRSFAWARRATALVIAPVLTWLVVFVAAAEHDALSVATFAAIPVAGLTGALTAREGHAQVSMRRMILVGAAVLIVANAVASLAYPGATQESERAGMGMRWSSEGPAGLERLGRIDALREPAMSSSTIRSGDSLSTTTWPDEALLAAYPTMRMELWAVGPREFRLDPAWDGPVASVPFVPAPPQWVGTTILGVRVSGHELENPGQLGAMVALSERAWWPSVQQVIVGVDATGERTLLSLGASLTDLRFSGTIWQWLSADRSGPGA